MHTPAWVAIVAAVAIELIGLSAVSLGLELRTYNARKRAKDPAAPVRIAYGIMGGYIVTVIILSILLDAAITLATVARAVFPLLSLAAFGILALEDDHGARVAQVAQDRTQEREERAARKAERAQVTAQEIAPAIDTRGKVLAYYRNNPHGTFTDAASEAGVSRQRVAQVVKALETEGVINRNGKVTVTE
jgi:hypothetical protein